MENRASKNYKNFIESIYYYNELVGKSDINSILETAYPVFYDTIMHAVKMKKKQKESEKRERDKLSRQATPPKRPAPNF